MKAIYIPLIVFGFLLGLVAMFRLMDLFNRYIPTDKAFLYLIMSAVFCILTGGLIRQYHKMRRGDVNDYQLNYHKSTVATLWVGIIMIILFAIVIYPFKAQSF